MVDFAKYDIKLAKSYAAGAGVKFAKETWTKEWKAGGKAESPLSLIANAFRGKEFSKVCSNQELKNQYFIDECDREITLGGKKVKVVDVLKSAYSTNSNLFSSGTDWRIAVKEKGGSWSDQPKVENYSDLIYKGYSKGLVAEQCPQLGPSFWDPLGVISDTANKTVCEKILEGVFGDTVNQKRYCFDEQFVSRFRKLF
ncbi:hypothetical protein MHLP_03550 [Candidatus Mycoplasma haematolamae str. Purdue]|uniref:Uncharacterized protein n=1 Tax=Mycoplasma haematolamae (strain Purdue) TaxID=1212765 RepID=I7BAG4_MYCHA|nr:hypothetical protein [Candidatus Mycoplasma haematolamae]AFO52290.1 hypothetical protein MHLP_03550 [Candidatus Mycoplasma haematolamae str. Purdue]